MGINNRCICPLWSSGIAWGVKDDVVLKNPYNNLLNP
jgi:hypothetical protein